MKQVLLAVLMVFMFQGMAIADDGEGEDTSATEVEGVREGKGKGKNFETRKAKALENIAKKRGLLGDLESCIGSANAREDMKACRQKHKQAIHAIHPNKKEMKKKHKKRKNRKKDRH